MKKSRFKKPYTAKGGANFPEARNRSGVYLIKKAGKISYIGRSGYNVLKTMLRHFQRWNDPSQPRVSYFHAIKRNPDKFKVRIILCSPQQSERLERYLIKKLEPKDNPDKLKAYQLEAFETRAGKKYESLPAEDLSDLPF